MVLFKKKKEEEGNLKIIDNVPKIEKEEKNKEIQKLKKEIEELKQKIKTQEIINETLKEEIKRKEKQLKLKETLKNLDKKVILIFDPIETYQKIMDTEDPQKIETIVNRLYRLERQKDWKYIQELYNRIKPLAIWIIILGVGLILVGTGAYIALKTKTLEPKVIEKTKVIVVPENEIQKVLNENKPKTNITNNKNNIATQKENENYVPVEKVIR